jgi:hypothetical protein
LKINKKPDGYHIVFERKDWSRYSLKSTVIPAIKKIKTRNGLPGWTYYEDEFTWIVNLDCGGQLEQILNTYVRPIDDAEKHDQTVDMLTGMDRNQLKPLKRGYR